MFEFDYIILKGVGSPLYGTGYNPTKFIDKTRLIKSYDLPDIAKTEVPFQTLVNPNSYERVVLQTRTRRFYEFEIYFKENIDLSEIEQASKIELTDRNGRTFECEFLEKNAENIGETTIKKGTFKFSEFLQTSESVASHVASDYIENRTDLETEISLEFELDKDIGDLRAGSKFKFYTIFYPIFDREAIQEDKELNKTKTGQVFTITTYDCEIISLKFYLNDSDLRLFRKIAKRCYYEENGLSRGILLNNKGGQLYAQQTINSDDIEINTDENLIDLNEVNLVLRRDFIKFEK
jgi:hypothetical protein